jgi:GrpB-like predicted nucleotidyltransferase (UPF0157 family)
MIIGLPADILQFLPYNPEWKILFEEEKQQLQSTIGNDIVDIQHIGSTSIPGIIAKPILDIGIAVNNFEEAAICIKPLEKMGYTYKGESGIPRRHWFAKGEPTTHHVHILEIHSQNWKNNLIFRDYLKRNLEIAKQYAELKMQLLKQFNADRDAYQEAKKPFIEQVLKQAQSK